MSELLSGLLSGLVGAVAGGAFTALAARAQVRAAIQVAQLQIAAERRHQAETLFRTRQLDSAAALCKRLLHMQHEVQKASEEHYFNHHHGKEDPVPAPAPAAAELRQMNDWRLQLDQIQGEFRPLLTDEEDDELTNLFSHVTFGDVWEKIAQRYPNASCPQCRWGDDFWSDLATWIRRIQRKMADLSSPPTSS